MNLKPFSPVDTHKRYIGNFFRLRDISIFVRNTGIVYPSVVIVETAYIHASVLIVEAALIYVT